MDLLRGELGSCSDTCVISTVVGNEMTGIRAGRVSIVTEEEDQELTTIPEIKTETKVSVAPSKGFIRGVYALCFFAACSSWNRNIFSAFSTFTSRPVSLQWTNEAYGVYVLTRKLTSSA